MPSFRSPRRPINLSRDAFRHLAAALGLAVLSASVRADWSLQSAAGAQEPHLTINTWTPAEGLSATNQAGKLITIPTRDILSLQITSSPSTPQPAPRSTGAARSWKLALRNGDLLLGTPEGISGQSLTFTTPELRSFSIPLKNVATLASPKSDLASSRLAGSDKDVVRLANGDRLEGIIANISDSRLDLATEGADNPTSIPVENIASIAFGGAAIPRVPPLSARLHFASGSTVTFPLDNSQAFSWTLQKLTVKDPAGQDHPVDASQLTSVDILGGRNVYLTDIDPAREDVTTFLGTPWPMQVDKNVLGQPLLRVAETNFPRGIGVHTQSTLVYDLDGSFDSLSFRVGMDDSAAPYGEAKASILLDGKTLWSSDALKPGKLSSPVSIPVAGGHRLELHADPTTRLDVLGRVDWIDVALHRK